MALLSDINGVTGGGDACSILQVPLDALSSAAQSLEDLKQNPPAGIRELANQIRRLEIPNIDRTADLAAGIRALREQLPTDTSAVTGQLSDQIGGFFEGVNNDLTGELSSSIGGLGSVSSLSSLGIGGAEDSNAPGVLESIQNLRNSLSAIPTPITVPTLLDYLLEALKKFPRSIVPLRYLPIVDELRDKLETALAWQGMNGTELADHLGATLDQLAAAIDRNFITEGVGRVATELQHLGSNVDDTALATGFDDLISGINALKQAVNTGSLAGSMPAIATVKERLATVQTALGDIDEHILQGQANRLNLQLAGLGEEMDDRALQFLAVLNPPSDLDILSFLLGQVNTLLENTGVAALIAKIGEFLGAIRSVLNSLNISAIKDTFLGVVNTAVEAVETLREALIRVTIEFSAIMERVRDAIASLGISDIVEGMENALKSFQQAIRNGVDEIFGPVRNFLLNSFNSLNSFLEQMDPSVVVQTLRDIISKFTDLLSNPQLLDALDSVKGALDTVNGELAGFSFKPGTDVVVQAIGVVESALDIAAGLPLPDSLKKELRDALNKLPRSIDPAVEIITDGLDEIVEEGPKPVLEAIKDGPKQLVEIVMRYSPDKLIGDCLSQSYNEFLTIMEGFRPTSLLAPIQTALDELKEAVQEAIDPVKMLEPLQEPFDELLALIDAIDPQAIIAPLNEQLQAGIRTITDNLPLEAANEIFDQIAAVADKIEYASDVLVELRDLFQDIRTMLNGLNDAEQQIQDFGNDVAARINQVVDISPVTTAMGAVGTALTSIHATGLQAALDPHVSALRTRLTNLDPKTKLTALAAAKTSFPLAALESMGPSLEKDELLSFLNSFNPVQAAFAAPVDFLDTWGNALETRRVAFSTFLNDWDSRILNPQGPLMQLHQPAITAQDLRELLSTTLEEQLTNALQPIFRTVDHFQEALDGLLAQITGFINDVQTIVEGILDVTDALEELRVAINTLVETLENFNLNFIADELQAVFDLLHDELQVLSPAHIGEILAEAFEGILSILDLDTLLGANALDTEYLRLLDTLRRFDPGKLIVAVLQPEFDKVIEFLKRLDLSPQIEAFLVNIDRLRAELRTELERCADAYENMWDAIPSSIGTVTGTVSVTVTT